MEVKLKMNFVLEEVGGNHALLTTERDLTDEFSRIVTNFFMQRPAAITQKDDVINDSLDGEVEFALSELGIAQGEILGEFLAPD